MVALQLDMRSAVTGADRAFIIEMARHACVIEDWPLPDAYTCAGGFVSRGKDAPIWASPWSPTCDRGK
jgi:hypothetical protein